MNTIKPFMSMTGGKTKSIFNTPPSYTSNVSSDPFGYAPGPGVVNPMGTGNYSKTSANPNRYATFSEDANVKFKRYGNPTKSQRMASQEQQLSQDFFNGGPDADFDLKDHAIQPLKFNTGGFDGPNDGDIYSPPDLDLNADSSYNISNMPEESSGKSSLKDRLAGQGDRIGMAASMAPMLVNSFKDMFAQSENAELFNNQEYYNSINLMRNQRIDHAALINESNRSANAQRQGNVSRSAQVSNALNTNIGAQNMQQIQNISLQSQQANNQYRSQEAQMRSQLGAQDREYRHQQDVEQSQNDANTRNMSRAASQNIWNLVGQNINNRNVHMENLKNQRMIAGMAATEKFAMLDAMSTNYGIDKDVAQQYIDQAMSGDYEAMKKVMDTIGKKGIFTYKE